MTAQHGASAECWVSDDMRAESPGDDIDSPVPPAKAGSGIRFVRTLPSVPLRSTLGYHAGRPPGLACRGATWFPMLWSITGRLRGATPFQDRAR
jgi:hypothetical protein